MAWPKWQTEFMKMTVVSRTAASSAGHFSHVSKTPTTSLSLDSVSDKLNDWSVCVERLNATVSNLSRSHLFLFFLS